MSQEAVDGKRYVTHRKSALQNSSQRKLITKQATIKSSQVNKLSDMNPLQSDIKYTGTLLTDLQPPSAGEVCRLIRNIPAKSSVMDRRPTFVIISSVDLFAPLIARLVTLSFTEGTFPSQFKVYSVTPLLKKKGLDCSVYANYRRFRIYIQSQRSLSELLYRELPQT